MSDIYFSDSAAASNQTIIKIKNTIVSIVPWAIVGALLWAGLFVKPTVAVEEVIKPAIENRDRIYGMHLIDDKNIWLCGNYGKILKTSNGGQSWFIQETPTRKHLQDISAWDINQAVAVGNGGVLLTTTDGGSSWQEIDVPKTEIADKLIRVHTIEGGEAWAVGEYGKILKSTDFGKSWTQKRENEDVILNDIVKLPGGKLIVVGEFGRMLISLDNGNNWEDLDSRIEAETSLMAVTFRDELNGVAVGLDGLIISTSDGGTTWTKPQSGYELHEHLMDVMWDTESKTWFSVGNKGAWLKANADLSSITTGVFDKVDLSWHTEVEKDSRGYLTVGANVGLYDPDSQAFNKISNELIR